MIILLYTDESRDYFGFPVIASSWDVSEANFSYRSVASSSNTLTPTAMQQCLSLYSAEGLLEGEKMSLDLVKKGDFESLSSLNY